MNYDRIEGFLLGILVMMVLASTFYTGYQYAKDNTNCNYVKQQFMFDIVNAIREECELVKDHDPIKIKCRSWIIEISDIDEHNKNIWVTDKLIKWEPLLPKWEPM